ncbi:hypothetical protein [Algoriphagus sp.]|uniref:hypothetical protein n=1 Tax=Algoriphagus sp. TaxID=1872435 RepID=UPI003F71A4AE
MHFVIDYNRIQKANPLDDKKEYYRIVRYPLPPPIPSGKQFDPVEYIIYFFSDQYTIYEAHYLLETLSLSVRGKTRAAYWDPQEGVNGFVIDFSRLLHAACRIRNQAHSELSVDEANHKAKNGNSCSEIFPFIPETNSLVPEIDPWYYLQIIFEKYSLIHLLYLIGQWGLATFTDAVIPKKISKNHYMDDLILNLILDCCSQICIRRSKKEEIPDVLGKLYMFRK